MLPEHSLPEKTQILLLTGFLGAGKTTLLKRVLSWEADLSRTVVLVNEFGEIGIDGLLLKDAGSDVVELTSGCICCTLSADLRQSLNRIWTQFHPRRLLIETSGIADPKTLIPLLQEPAFIDKMILKKTVTVLDADFWEARDVFGPLFYHQLESADLILLNKIDLIDPEKVPCFLKEIHEHFGGCRVVPTLHCGIDPEALFAESHPKAVGIPPIHFFRTAAFESFVAAGAPVQDSVTGNAGHDAHPDDAPVPAFRFVTFSFRAFKPLDESCFRRFLEDLPWGVFRVKGPVRFPDRLAMLNYVGKKAEWTDWNGEPETRLAFIGWGIDGGNLLEKLRQCVMEN
ncbi:MAG: GTP-binding protein [Deltaproteobacteria bacterium]|nr:GTP-binding protein [Deltaproteobacteria bacterium]MBW1954785.1 GTP-binding protein [Deltaproteobacteria bacterium]MBW2040670.1 GTP-binding protein [Deltaproteobacteria bacterium]MBW2132495.1 GTP-binding protein [Deltaproteobacteria bacterium]